MLSSLSILFLVLSIQGIIYGKWSAFLPSSAWFVIMVIPFLQSLMFQNQGFPRTQSFGISIIFLSLILGDFYGYKSMRQPQERAYLQPKKSALKVTLASLIILIPVLHYFSASEIPIFHIFNPLESTYSRENYSKLATLPYWLKMLPNIYFAFIAPLVLAFFLRLGNKKTFLILFFWASFYAISSTAEFVILIFLTMTAFSIQASLGFRHLRVLEILMGISLFTIILSGISVQSQLNSNPSGCGSTLVDYSTYTDKYLVCRENNQTLVNPLVDKVGYRVFLTPINVSSWWYKYYEENPHRSFQSIINRELGSQPSNIIGKIAYFDRFPNSFLKSISANSSIDADSFSFGWPFTWISGFILFIMRILSASGLRSKDFFERSSGAILLGGLILLPFTASIQAILIAQGMLIPTANLCALVIRKQLLFMNST